ncbi:MAG TPA: gephyrin-like molybdotransferase Glp [Candidatus Limnocylindrales bacterium]|nr:gephyrin-like molybdotransferase Glp [Candidatus Limnocylindrales bacterium]
MSGSAGTGTAAAGDQLLSVEEARDQILAAIAGPTPVESVDVGEARGRILAEDVVSLTALPPWDNSAMDGYAIRAADAAAATDEAPVRLDVVGEVRAGAAPDTELERGTAIRIATGAPVPSGADAVVQVELTTPASADGAPVGERGRDAAGPLPKAVLVHAAIASGTAIRRAGDDLAEAATILTAGMRIGAAGVALAAGTGNETLAVHALPRVGILATGDEVRAPGRDLGPAGIPDANGPGLAALVEEAGGRAQSLGIATDRLEDVRARLTAALCGDVDAIVVSGGVSVGPYDVVRAAFAEIGRMDLWRVAVQPGKPFAFGVAERLDGGSTLLFGLPGNPVSSFVTFELFVRPAIRRLAGVPTNRLVRRIDHAVLLEPATKSPGRRAFLRVVAERDAAGAPARDAEGRVRVRLAGGGRGQGSHVLSALALAEGLAIVPESVDAVEAGARLDLWWLDCD